MHTARLVLRRFTADDASAFAAMNADPRVMRHFPALLSRRESDALLERIEAHWDAEGFGPFAATPREDPSELLGFVGLMRVGFSAHFTPAVEIGWRVRHQAWNRGFATEGAAACLAFGFETLGLGEIVSFTAEGNAASRRVMEKLGMRRDPSEDFDHPKLPPGHRLRRHVLYRANVVNG